MTTQQTIENTTAYETVETNKNWPTLSSAVTFWLAWSHEWAIRALENDTPLSRKERVLQNSSTLEIETSGMWALEQAMYVMNTVESVDPLNWETVYNVPPWEDWEWLTKMLWELDPFKQLELLTTDWVLWWSAETREEIVSNFNSPPWWVDWYTIPLRNKALAA